MSVYFSRDRRMCVKYMPDCLQISKNSILLKDNMFKEDY